MTIDTNLSHGQALPGDLPNLAAFVRQKIRLLETMNPRHNYLRHQDQSGLPLPVRPQAPAGVPDLPVWQGGLRDHATIARWLACLIMPERFGACREDYKFCLDLADETDLATDLIELGATLPNAVTALLELRIRRAHKLMRASLSSGEFADYSERLLLPLFKVAIARWLHIEAMQCADELHRPFGYPPLDAADRNGMVRHGPTSSRWLREKDRVSPLLDTYERNRAQGIQVFGNSTSAALSTDTVFMPWHNDFHRSDATSDAHWHNIYRRAVDYERVLRFRHGHHLETILDKTLPWMRNVIQTGTSETQKKFPKGGRTNKRVGNIAAVDPLVHLLSLTRFAIGLTFDPVRMDWEKSDDTEAPISRVLEWLNNASREPSTFECLPASKNMAEAVHLSFALLRLAIVRDDGALPTTLRDRCVTKPDGSTDTIRVNSLSEAEEVIGSPLTYEELWEARGSIKLDKSEISKKAKFRLYSSLDRFPRGMRLRLQFSLERMTEGLTLK